MLIMNLLVVMGIYIPSISLQSDVVEIKIIPIIKHNAK